MASTIELDEYLAGIDIPDSIDRDWLTGSVLDPIGIRDGEPLADLCEDILLAAADTTAGELQMRPGGWRINVGASVVRTLLASCLVGAGLLTIGADQIPIELLPAVLPLLIDVEKVRLDRRERQLLIPLKTASAGIEGIAVNPEVLYNRFDPAVRTQLNYQDFLAFVDRLVQAGELDDAGLGDLSARTGKPAWIRLTWD